MQTLATIGIAVGVVGWVVITIHLERSWIFGDHWDAQDWMFDSLEWLYVRRGLFVLGTASGIVSWLRDGSWWWIAVMPGLELLRLAALGGLAAWGYMRRQA